MIRQFDRSSLPLPLPLLPQAFVDAALRRLRKPSDEARAQLARGLLASAGYLAAGETAQPQPDRPQAESETA